MPHTAVIVLYDSIDADGQRFTTAAVAPDILPCSKGGDVVWQVMNNSIARHNVRVSGFRKNPKKNHPSTKDPDDVDVDPGKTAPIPMKVDSKGVETLDRFKYNVYVNGILALDPELEVQPDPKLRRKQRT